MRDTLFMFRFQFYFIFRLFLISIILYLPNPALAQPNFSPTKTYNDSSANNQDDMAIWIHPTDRSMSLIIGSDKGNGNLYVYDLSGTTLQTITDTGGQPGNIDVRYNFPLSGQLVDIVGFNDRSSGIVRIFKVDPSGRTLIRVDNGSISSSPAVPNYGFGLYYNKASQKYYAFASKDNGGPVVQIELNDAGGGKIDGSVVKSWTGWSQTEGIVADDDHGFVFFAVEAKPIYKLNCQTGPCDPNSALSIDGGQLNADVEGITLYRTSDNSGYLLASSQGASEFEIYDRLPPHSHRGMFKVSGTSSTDGIDVTSVNLGSIFPQGVFLAHSGGASFVAVPWQSIANNFNLTIDTSWNPRSGVISPTSIPSVTPINSPTPLPSVTPNNTLMPTFPPITATLMPPADCQPNNLATLVCFEIWRREFTGVQNTQTADFNSDSRVDLVDFEIWRRAFAK